MKLGQGRYALIGHHFRTRPMPPSILPLPSHKSQSGHFAGGLGDSLLSSDNTDESSVDIPMEGAARDGIAVGSITKDNVGWNATAKISVKIVNANSLLVIVLLFERYNILYNWFYRIVVAIPRAGVYNKQETTRNKGRSEVSRDTVGLGAGRAQKGVGGVRTVVVVSLS